MDSKLNRLTVDSQPCRAGPRSIRSAMPFFELADVVKPFDAIDRDRRVAAAEVGENRGTLVAQVEHINAGRKGRLDSVVDLGPVLKVLGPVLLEHGNLP